LDYNVAAMLCYLPACLCCVDLIFCILWLVTEPKENRFIRFHAMQGLLLFGVGFVIGIIFWILRTALFVGGSTMGDAGALGAAGAGLFLVVIQAVIGLALLIVHIMGCIKAYNNEMWKIPVIGNIAEKNS